MAWEARTPVLKVKAEGAGDRVTDLGEIPEHLHRAVRAARTIKEAQVTEADNLDPGGTAESPTTVEFLRNGKLVALVELSADRDSMVQAISLGASCFAADEVCAVHEMYSVRDFEKAMGRRPDPGEFQRLFLAGRTDLVGESLGLMRGIRGGDRVEAVDIGYDLDRTTGILKWRSARYTADLKGRLPYAILESFKSPTVAERAVDAGLEIPADMSAEEARFHEDVAAAKVMALAGFPVALAHSEGWQAEIVQRSFDEGTLATSSDGCNWVLPPPDRLTVVDVLGAEMRAKLERERAEAWLADEQRAEGNRAQRRRAEAEARKRGSR